MVARMAPSLARAPYATVSASSTLATAVPRAESVPISPVYQVTVLAGVPAMRDVALLNGGPFTRIGGWPASTSKKLFAAAIVEAADSEVAASFWTAPVRAAWKFVAVSLGNVPIVNWPGPGGELVVAVSVSCWLVPSGRLKPK